MTNEVIVDALPYIDQGYDEPGIREAVSIFPEKSNVENEQVVTVLDIYVHTGDQYGRR